MEELQIQPAEQKKGIFNSAVIKWIAIVAMIIDHTAWAYVNSRTFLSAGLHTIGQITGPIMFFFIAEGYHYTKNLKKYLFRLFIFALISQIPFNLFDHHTLFVPFTGNVGMSLFCALLALICWNKLPSMWLKIPSCIALTAVTYYFDWPTIGVLITLAFGIFYGDRSKQLAAYWMVNVYKIAFTYLFMNGSIYSMIPAFISPFLVTALILMYNGKKGGGKITSWSFYLIYPLHLLILDYFIFFTGK